MREWQREVVQIVTNFLIHFCMWEKNKQGGFSSRLCKYILVVGSGGGLVAKKITQSAKRSRRDEGKRKTAFRKGMESQGLQREWQRERDSQAGGVKTEGCPGHLMSSGWLRMTSSVKILRARETKGRRKQRVQRDFQVGMQISHSRIHLEGSIRFKVIAQRRVESSSPTIWRATRASDLKTLFSERPPRLTM